MRNRSVEHRTPNTKCDFEYIDMSVKEPYDTGWKDKVKTRIKRSDGIIALISADSLTSTGQKWEIECAKEESKPVLPLWIYKDDRTKPAGLSPVVWTWDGVKSFIDSL